MGISKLNVKTDQIDVEFDYSFQVWVLLSEQTLFFFVSSQHQMDVLVIALADIKSGTLLANKYLKSLAILLLPTTEKECISQIINITFSFTV